MVSECLCDSAELAAVHFIHFVVPSCQIKACRVFVHLLVEYVCQIHCQVVGPFQFRIELKDDVGSPLLGACPLRGMLGQDIFRSGKQLFACIPVGVAERYISRASLAATCNFFVLHITNHPSQGYAQFVDCVIIEL